MTQRPASQTRRLRSFSLGVPYCGGLFHPGRLARVGSFTQALVVSEGCVCVCVCVRPFPYLSSWIFSHVLGLDHFGGKEKVHTVLGHPLRR